MIFHVHISVMLKDAFIQIDIVQGKRSAFQFCPTFDLLTILIIMLSILHTIKCSLKKNRLQEIPMTSDIQRVELLLGQT